MIIFLRFLGSFLVDLLFVPGIAMIFGGAKYNTQKFNPKAASILL
jgi:Ca2+/H+ antiporter